MHQKTLNRLVRFIDQFQQMNFANDTEMARQRLVAGLSRLGAEARSLAQQDASELVQRFGSLGQRKFELAA
ncbi:MAG: hypothetical protein ABMA26_23515 [Limisphaerales bacterium]